MRMLNTACTQFFQAVQHLLLLTPFAYACPLPLFPRIFRLGHLKKVNASSHATCPSAPPHFCFRRPLSQVLPASVPPLCLHSDRLRHIAKVWSAFLASTAAAAAAAAAAFAAAGGGGGGDAGMIHFHPLGLAFGPVTEPGPLDTTGRLPSELLESMFDYLDEDMTINCASVARRYVLGIPQE